MDDHVLALLTLPGGAWVACRRATNPAQLSLKPPAHADRAIGAALKDIQEWDNRVCICRLENAGSQSACL